MAANLKEIVIIGGGGSARDTLDVIDAINNVALTYHVAGFIVDAQYGSPGTIINDKPILGDFRWLEQHPTVSAVVAVGAPQHRLSLVKRVQQAGVTDFPILIHPNAVLTRWVRIGYGTIITAGCILTNQITIGEHVHLNLDCTVAHDTIIEDYVTVAPGVHVSGNVTLKTGAYIGTGANLIEKITVHEWTVIGAGSSVVSSIPANTTAVGVPAKVIKTREAGWHLF